MSGSTAGTLTVTGVYGPNINRIISTFFRIPGGKTYQLNGTQRVAVNEIIDYSSPIVRNYSPYSSLTGDYVVVIDNEKMKNLNKIIRIEELKDNWDGDGAEPFSKSLISSVRQIITGLYIQPEVFPTAADSIQLEYEKDDGSYLEFEIGEDKKAAVFSIDSEGNETNEEITVDLDVINEMVAQFYG